MADYFEPSPQASKRRRTTTYKTSRSVLDKRNAQLEEHSIVGSPKQQTKQQNRYEDSAYGSKEDSLVEEDAPIKRSIGERDATMSGNGKESAAHRLNLDQAQQNTGKEGTPLSGAFESENEAADDTIAIQPRSSGRERRKPRRYSMSPEKPKPRVSMPIETSEKDDGKAVSSKKRRLKGVTTPKGILTPSRKEKGTGVRKSVIFDQDEKAIEEQFGFKDINTSTLKKPRTLKLQSRRIGSNIDEELPLTPSKNLHKQVSPPVPEPESELEFDAILTESLDETVLEPVTVVEEQLEVDKLSVEDDPAILAIKSQVLTRLVSRSTVPVPLHLQSQYESLHSLLHATVTAGESNSLLLVGARGVGKSQLLESAIWNLNTKHPDHFHTVRLNGFYQTDDKLALREIWRQLGREMQVDETDTGEVGGSYADTMSSLLSLLSHPEEFADPAVPANRDAMQADASSITTSKSVVFVLDEFDLFTTHPRQTLLYNLFDIAQSKKAPIAVVGCSTRMDVVDCLEKRVKSRFSHRWLHVPSATTLSAFEEIVKNAICVEEEESVAAMKVSTKDMEARKRWNAYIQSTCLKSTPVRDLIQQTFYTTRSIPEVLTALYTPVAMLQLPAPGSDESTSKITKSICAIHPPTLLTLLPSLPTLHIALLVAASRLDTIHNLSTLNFNLVYAHYVELILRSKLQVTASGAVAVGASLRQWSRETAKSAWEDLGLYECIVPVSGAASGAGSTKDAGGDSIGGEGASVRMWRVDVTLEELGWAIKEKWTESGGVRDVLAKWCREI